MLRTSRIQKSLYALEDGLARILDLRLARPIAALLTVLVLAALLGAHDALPQALAEWLVLIGSIPATIILAKILGAKD